MKKWTVKVSQEFVVEAESRRHAEVKAHAYVMGLKPSGVIARLRVTESRAEDF